MVNGGLRKQTMVVSTAAIATDSGTMESLHVINVFMSSDEQHQDIQVCSADKDAQASGTMHHNARPRIVC